MTRIIAVTDFVYGKAIFRLPKQISRRIQEKIVLKSINDKDVNPDLVKIYWGTRINDKILKKFKNLEWIHFGSIGTDKLSFNNLKNKKIKITNSRGTNTEAMSKLILMYILDLERKVLKINNNSDRNIYEDEFINAINLKKKKILVLGYGRISKKIGSLLSNFKIDVEFFSNRAKLLKLSNVHNLNYISKNLKNYKLIINLLKYNVKNYEFINQKFLKKLNTDIKLILVGRIETVNLNDLLKFLKSNRKSFAYMDAKSNFDNIKIFNKLKKLKNLFLTPHIGGYYVNYWRDQFELFNFNLNNYLSRKKLKNIVKINKDNFL